MSIDLYVIPTALEPVIWGEVLAPWFQMMQERGILDPVPTLLSLPGEQPVQPSERLMLEHHYRFDPDSELTLTLGVMEGFEHISAAEWLEIYGPNLTTDEKADLAVGYHRAGYDYLITTFAGRSKREGQVLITLATAVAQVCEGYVGVVGRGFDRGIGVYSPNIFRNARWVS